MGEAQISRWVVGAVLVATGPLLVYPLEALAQDTATLKCEFTDTYSLATIENTNKEKKNAICRWKCIYQLKWGGTHINEGAKKLRYQEKKTTKKGGKSIQHVVGTSGICP